MFIMSEIDTNSRNINKLRVILVQSEIKQLQNRQVLHDTIEHTEITLELGNPVIYGFGGETLNEK